ncbi:MAG: hypothetical protein JW973_02755 [Bacteroidales bacterium]|nr:hypothetical protein [Bacteroidales bacterium]
MDIQQIRILLDKYEKSETSLEEEQVLCDYFTRQTDIPAGFEAYQMQFQYYESVRSISHRKPELEKKIENLIDRESEQKSTSEIGQRTVTPLNRKIYRWIAAAAIIIIVGTMVLILNRNRKPDMGTFDDPQLAYIEAQKTLLYVSQKLNHGTKELSNLSKFNSGVENLRNLEKLNSGLDQLQLISLLNEKSNDEKK